jgi:O-antigen/teichoic acid export membrane protein
MYSYSQFTKHVFGMGLLNLFSVVQGLVFLPIITKVLGAEDYGIWSQLKITMGILVPFALLGLQESLTRFIPATKDKKTMQEGVCSSLVVASGMTIFFSLILLFFSGPAASFLKFNQTFIRLLSAMIIFESLNAIILVVIQAMREIKKYFWFTTLKMFGETGLVIGAIFLGCGLYGAILSLLVIRVIIFFILFIFLIFKIGLKIPDFSLIKSYLRFGTPTLINNISYPVVTSADRYLIAFFLGIVFVGYYAPAYSLAMLLGFFLFPLASMLSVILPKFFDENDISQVKKYLRYSLKYYLLIIIPSVFGLSFLSKSLLSILSTEKIASASYLVVPLIAISVFLYGVSYFFNQVLVLVKKTKLIAIIWVIAAILNLGLNIIFIPIFGILAAATVTLISYLCAFLLTWYFSMKEFKFEIDWWFVVKSFASSAVMAVFIIWFDPAGLLKTVITVITSILIYTGLILLFKGIDRREIRFFKNMIFSDSKL